MSTYDLDGLDNDGVGFAFGSDAGYGEDLDAMLNDIATDSEEPEMDDAVEESTPAPRIEEPVVEAEFEAGDVHENKHEDEENVEAALDPETETVTATSSTTFVTPAAPAPTAVVVPGVTVPGPVHQAPVAAPVAAPAQQAAPSPLPKTSPRVHIPTSADELRFVQRVLRINEVLSQMNRETRYVVDQFTSSGSAPENNDNAEMVVNALNANPMLATVTHAIKEAAEMDDVERSFFIMEMANAERNYLSVILSMFLDEPISPSMSAPQQSRLIVRAIASLDQKVMGYILATESVLSAASDQS